MFWMYKNEIIGAAGRLSALYGKAYKLDAEEQRVLQSIISFCIENDTTTFIRNHVYEEDKAGNTHPGFNGIVKRLEEKKIVKRIGKPKGSSGKAVLFELKIEYHKVTQVVYDLKNPKKASS